MRLDKFLKVSRLVRRRQLANDLCDNGNVLVDGKVAKASSVVYPGQTLTLRFGNRLLRVRIEQVPEKAVPLQQAAALYQVIQETLLDSPL